MTILRTRHHVSLGLVNYIKRLCDYYKFIGAAGANVFVPHPHQSHVTWWRHLVVEVVVFVVVVVVVILVANHDFLDPVDVSTHSSEDGWMSGTGTRAPRPADYAFQRPVGRLAAKTTQRTTRVALAGALVASRVPGTQHRRLDEVIVPWPLIALPGRIILHRHLIQSFQWTAGRCR